MVNSRLPVSRKIKKRAAQTARKQKAREEHFRLLEFIKAKENPILSPNPENGWEAWQTFNPGVILLDDKIHFIYRAIGEDYISRFGYASSQDGFIIDERLPYPVFEHISTGYVYNYFSLASGGSFGGCEDPRITRVKDEDRLYMTYTACDQGLGLGLTSIGVDDFIQKKWNWKRPILISPPGEIHKNWVIFPEKINNKYAILHSITPEICVEYRDSMEFGQGECIQSNYKSYYRGKECWDTFWRGAGAPPIKTKFGWLLFYHAIDRRDPGKYKVGALLLDLNDPTKILYNSQKAVLEPEKDYENNGFKPGIVYVSGAVVKNGELMVYYGASDSYISVAFADLEEFINGLVNKTEPKLKAKALKKKKS